jgi:integrase
MRKQRSAWNRGRLLGQKPPLKPKEIWSLRILLQLAGKARDLVSLRVRDVYQGGVVSSRAIVIQRKTQRPVQFEITEATRESIAAWIARCDLRSTSHLFPGRGDERHLSVRQYSRIVKHWAGCIGLDQSRYGTHSLRRTKATLIYKRSKNIRAIQLLLGHTKLESTVRYLGIEVDDALEISEQTEI